MDTRTAPQNSRIVAVTRAGTGIGRATARAFAAEGAHVLAVGRRAEPLHETAAGHERITSLTADITAAGEPDRVIHTARELHGRLDVLVNNAGIVRSGALGTLTPEVITPQIATNLIAPVLLTQAAPSHPHCRRTSRVARRRDLPGQRRDLLTGTRTQRQRAPRQPHSACGPAPSMPADHAVVRGNAAIPGRVGLRGGCRRGRGLCGRAAGIRPWSRRCRT
jgi:NAD(P)-dependent dehydrogenase (short-subunit alcohol dehydrogenase family)